MLHSRGAVDVVTLTEGDKDSDTLYLREENRRPAERRTLFQRFPSLANLRRGAVAEMLQRRDERIETHLYLQTKYRELQKQFTTLRNRYFLIECAWCTRRIGWKPKRGSVPGDTSHGICPPCAADMVREIAKLPSTPPYSINYTIKPVLGQRLSHRWLICTPHSKGALTTRSEVLATLSPSGERACCGG